VTDKQQVLSSEAKEGIGKEDLDFVSETSAAILIDAPKGGRILLWISVAFLVSALYWANWAQLDEVTRGQGTVIPSSQIQVIQNLEGGILSAMFVTEGQLIEKGHVLAQIDDTRFSSSLRESQQQSITLKAKAARLQAEVDGVPFILSEELAAEKTNVVRDELALYKARQQELNTTKSILKDQSQEIKQELAELESKKAKLKRSYDLLKRELALSRPLIAAGAISEVEVLRLERQVSEMRGELDGAKLAKPRLHSKLRASMKKVNEVDFRFTNEARVELNAVSAELLQMNESSVALEDRVDRTAVRSPVKGTVKRIMVTTIGGVIQPGEELMEIVPLDDTLLVEAEINPKDIAFLHTGLKAVVKLSAYDFAIYGGLEGVVEHISADTITSDRDEESYYLVKIRTKETALESTGTKLRIIPGMLAEIDILTGKKTVLDYILKPILRAKSHALRER